MVAAREHKSPQDRLCCGKVPVRKQASGTHNLRRQTWKRGNLFGGRRRISTVACHSVNAFEHPPTVRQCRIDVDRSQERMDGRGDVAQAKIPKNTPLEEK